MQKAGAIGLRTRLLPPWNDLDTVDDLLDFYRKYTSGDLGPHLIGRDTLDYLSGLDITGR